MKKRAISVIVCMIMLFWALPAFADSDNANKAQPKTYTLSLDEAIALAQENSQQLEVIEGKKRRAEHSLKLAISDRSKVEGIKVKMPAGINTALMQGGYFVDQRENELSLVEHEMEQAKATIAYSVSEKYYNCILMQNFLNSAKDTYNLATENKTKVDKMLSLGMITQIEADNAALAVEQTRLAVENYERQYALAIDMLKVQLELSDYDFETATLVLTDKVEYSDFTADVVNDIKLSKEQRYDMLSLKGSVAVMKRYTELIARHLGSKSATYTEAIGNLENLEYNFSNARKQIGILVKSQYSNVLSAKGNIKTAEMALSVAKSQYDAAKLKFDLGMITNIELTDQLNAMHEKEIALEQAKINYMLATDKYKYEVAIGL